ncbi:hypothetical protein V6N13_004878 [Hibiscus sabdariffa]|uniref:Uncharacterized protein n=1 Tax=Hibiscus sabdariffa TaxID=183260 RepID=A0ABR2S0F9_9ROSI
MKGVPFDEFHSTVSSHAANPCSSNIQEATLQSPSILDVLLDEHSPNVSPSPPRQSQVEGRSSSIQNVHSDDLITPGDVAPPITRSSTNFMVTRSKVGTLKPKIYNVESDATLLPIQDALSQPE